MATVLAREPSAAVSPPAISGDTLRPPQPGIAARRGRGRARGRGRRSGMRQRYARGHTSRIFQDPSEGWTIKNSSPVSLIFDSSFTEVFIGERARLSCLSAVQNMKLQSDLLDLPDNRAKFCCVVHTFCFGKNYGVDERKNIP